MKNRLGVCLLVLVSACAVDAGNEGEVEQALAQSGAELARPAGPKPEAEACKLAETYDASKLAVRSCIAGRPIDASGLFAESTTGDVRSQACMTYQGSCSGVNGCSRAVGGGWEFTACGTFLFAWMTICDGQPTGWGTGFCLF